MTPELLDRIGLIAGAVFTVAIFSYLLGDNFLYRIAVNIFIGVTAAFVLITAVESVLIPWINATILAQPLEIPRVAVGLIPLLMGFLLMFKLSPGLSRLGGLGLVFVLGVGTAIALWGAVNGTLIPLVTQTGREFRQNVVEGFIIIAGTVSVLVYFTYLGIRRQNGEIEQLLPIRVTGAVGRFFLMITFGATYGLLIISALTVLTNVIVERLLILRPGG